VLAKILFVVVSHSGHRLNLHSVFVQNMSADALEGDITVPGLSSSLNDTEQQEFNTLDEPIKDTIVSSSLSLGHVFPVFLLMQT
jgi:hypothetical protein